MTRVVLDEYAAVQVTPFGRDIADALQATGAVTVAAGLAGDTWTVRAAQHVGVVRAGDVEVWIRPKVGIGRLLFLLGYARDPRGWRDWTVPLADAELLLPAMAELFGRSATSATELGLLQGYRETEEDLMVLRGRLRETDQLGRLHGLPVPLSVRYDEFTIDIAENRLLLAATQRLLRSPGVQPLARQRLVRLRARFADEVARLVPGERLPAWRPTRLNARYHHGLRLAEIVLRGRSVDQHVGQVSVSGFLFDMNKVFEEFVTVALGSELVRRGGRVTAQERQFLDAARSVRMKPDLVWRRSGGVARAVVDAKYKAINHEAAPNADLYQMLAYCTVLGLPQGHLVYAAGNEPPASYDIAGAAKRIVQHVLRLDLPPDGVLAQVADIVSDIAADAVVRAAAV